MYIFYDTDGGRVSKNQLRSSQSSSSNVVALVDRSADISAAAEMIVRARISPDGKSLYAPDTVPVNEFAIKEFCQAAMKASREIFADVR